MEYTITSRFLTVTTSSHGAEVISCKKDGTEYIWNGDPAYWGRRAPVLFPFVGQVRDKKYRYGGQEYPMGQHGFARDEEFALLESTETSVTWILTENERTQAVYPFSFELLIRYEIFSNALRVAWTVRNTDVKDLHFSIGGHPAFMCPLNAEGTWQDYRIEFRKKEALLDKITVRPITSGGCVGAAVREIPLEDGRITPTDELFAGDALILEDAQADEIALAGPDGKNYLAVRFDTPVAGVWSPVGKHAPFICIEPWYGRTDRDDFTGTLEEREYGMRLVPGGEFTGGYEIIVKK